MLLLDKILVIQYAIKQEFVTSIVERLIIIMIVINGRYIKTRNN